MSVTFFPGNTKLFGFAVQVDKDTPAGAPTFATRITTSTRQPFRSQQPLEWTDASTQRGATHVTAITPGIAFDTFLYPSLFRFLAEAVLGDEESAGDEHTSTPTLNQPYFTIWEVDGPYCAIYDGCRLDTITLQGQSEGDTKIVASGITWLVLGGTHSDAEAPDLTALLTDEMPFIFAETKVSYDGDWPGTANAWTLTIARNGARRQGDGSFRAIDVTPGMFAIDGSVSRFMQDDETLRSIDTGSPTGTAPTTDIAVENDFELEFARTGVVATITVAEVAYQTLEDPVNLDGAPKVETLGFVSQPVSNLEDHVVAVIDLAA